MQMASQQQPDQYPVAGNTAMTVREPIQYPEERIVHPQAKPVTVTVPATTTSANNNRIDLLLKSFVEGKDFIKLPQGQKVLLKSACYKIINFYNMRVKIDLIDKKIEPSSDLVAYTVSVKLVSEEGSVEFEALASANSNEKRFKNGGITNDSTVIVMAQSRGLRTCARWLLYR